MSPLKVHRNGEDTPRIRENPKNIPSSEEVQGSRVEQLSGILSLKDPRIIEEIAENDLLAYSSFHTSRCWKTARPSGCTLRHKK